MLEKAIKNNKVSVVSEIISEFTFSHGAFGGDFYMVDVAAERLNDQRGILPLMVSERLLDVCQGYPGSTMEAIGQLHSYNHHEGIRNRLELLVFVQKIRFMEEFTDYIKANRMSLDGYICKPLVYRRTPLGRGITDILLAIN